MDKKNLPTTIEDARFCLGVRLEYQSAVVVTETLKDGFDALNELATLSSSWNKTLGFIPDFANSNKKSGFHHSNLMQNTMPLCLMVRN